MTSLNKIRKFLECRGFHLTHDTNDNEENQLLNLRIFEFRRIYDADERGIHYEEINLMTNNQDDNVINLILNPGGWSRQSRYFSCNDFDIKDFQTYIMNILRQYLDSHGSCLNNWKNFYPTNAKAI